MLLWGLLFSLVIVHSFDPLKASPCGAPCGGNADCSDPKCGSCRLGRCVGSGNCRSYCDPNQDINLWCYNSYCTTCDKPTNSCLSTCGAPCTYPTECVASCNSCANYRCARACGAACSVDGDCANDGVCIKCTDGTCQKPTGCLATCNSNSDCINNKDGCTKCVRNQCVKGGCNSICYYTPDCLGQGNCTQCYGRFYPGGYGVCTGSCGAPCSGPEQCNGTLTNCGLCSNGACGPSSVCGIACQNDAGCAGNCHRCIAGICTKNAACGEPCETNAQCDINTCPYCTNGKCST